MTDTQIDNEQSEESVADEQSEATPRTVRPRPWLAALGREPLTKTAALAEFEEIVGEPLKGASNITAATINEWLTTFHLIRSKTIWSQRRILLQDTGWTGRTSYNRDIMARLGLMTLAGLAEQAEAELPKRGRGPGKKDDA